MVLIEVVLAILAVLFVYFKWSFRYWERRNVPCASAPTIPYGHFTPQVNFAVFMKNAYLEAKAKGLPHTGVYVFTVPNYLPLNLDEIKHVLQGGFSQFPSNGVYSNENDDLLSSSILFIAGDRWQYLRKKLSPILTASKRRLLLDLVVKSGRRLREFLEDRTELDAHQVANSYSTDVVATVALSLDADAYRDPTLVKLAKECFNFRTKLRRMVVAFASVFPRLARWMRVVLFDDAMNEFFLKAVKDAVAFRRTNQIAGLDMLQLLLEEEPDSKNLTDAVIQELTCQIFTVFNAGFETTSMALTFCLYELAVNSSIQGKLRSEIRAVLARHQGEITWDALNAMTYLDQVVKETLRKYPPIPGLSRKCDATHTIPNTATVIEKGTMVTISTWGLHYDPEYYPEPDKFDPERFAKEVQQIPFTYLPFGEGPRMCPGFTFGLILIKVGLIALLERYRFTLNKQTKLPIRYGAALVSLEPQSPLILNLEKV